MVSLASLTVSVRDIAGFDFDERRSSVWIEPNVPFVLADGILVGGRREQVVDGVATFSQLVTTDSADNPASFGYRVTITAPPKGSRNSSDIVTLTTSDFPFTESALLHLIEEAWDGVTAPVTWRSAFLDSVDAKLETAAASADIAVAAADLAESVAGADTADDLITILDNDPGSLFRIQQDARHSKTYAAVFTPEAYGAVGDGVTDDTTAVQDCFTAAGNATGFARSGALVMLSQSYRITRNLYGFGATTFEGPGELVIDADMSLADGHAYWWNMGIKAKAGAKSKWTGRMSVNVRATNNAVYERTVNLHYAEDCEITRCRFDLTAMPLGGIEYPGGAVVGYDNSAWCINPSRKLVKITENTFIAAQTAALGSEGIGIGPAKYVWVLDNYVYGFGDDPIAIHAVDHFTVRGNRCFTPDGRLIIRSSRWGTVADNHLERIANPNGTYTSGGGLLEFNLYAAGSWPASTAVTVSNNYLHLPAGVTGPTYMMRVKGIRDCQVVGNELHSDSPDTSVAGIVVEAETLDGWIDPTGVDTGGVAKLYALRVDGNYVSGAYPRSLSENGSNIIGPVTYRDNLFASYTVASSGSIFAPSNRVTGGNPNSLASVDGKCIPLASLLFEGDLAATAGAITKVTRNGVDRWYPRRKCIITAIEVETAAALTAGYFTVQLKKNGAAAASSDDVGVDTSTARGRRVTYYAATNNRATAATDYFEVITQGVGLTPTPLQCRVRVFGIYTDI